MAYEDAYDRTIALAYDPEYSVIRDPVGDRAFYAELAREAGGPVLELGCGTGRVLLPIAREGIAAVGLDASAAMLDVLRSKDPPPNLTLVQGTMTDFDLGAGRFPLVFSAFRPFQHLCSIEEQLATLACVRRHLAPGGIFAFDVFAPSYAACAVAEEPEQGDARVLYGDVELRRYATVRRDLVTQMIHVRFRHERWRGETLLSEEASEVHMRWFHRFELEHLLARAGFVIAAMYGGFDRRPYDAVGEMIILAKAAG
jgi:SAM-dependent methyltransferase